MLHYNHPTMAHTHAQPCAPGAASPLTRDLLDWFARERRDLPWRHTRDPYRILVAETMLIQTQVTTVIPYYERFLSLFPDVEALAAAPLDDVLKAWEGLGYYARARNLHRTAREVVARHGGRIPDDPRAVRALPGLGEYTSAALLSIAFGYDEAAIDGNVRRVFSRLFHLDGALNATGQARLRALVQEHLPAGAAGEYNQALMDLGATICTPRRPRCGTCPEPSERACPLAAHCEARRRGDQEQLPARPPRRQLPHYQVTAAVIRHEGRILIAQRPAEGLLGGLWEFPGGKCEPGETLRECLRREIREELGVQIEVGDLLASVEHAFTHFRITLHAFDCRMVKGEPRALGVAAWRWVSLDELDGFAFGAADRQVIARMR